MTTLPKKKYAFGAERRRQFRWWLSESGFTVLPVTTLSEILKFRAPDGRVGTVRKNRKSKLLTFDELAADTYRLFAERPNRPIHGSAIAISSEDPVVISLRKRDGDACFYCGDVVAAGDETIEHLLAIHHGGPNHIANLALAHRECNADAGHLPIVEKVRLREARMTE